MSAACGTPLAEIEARLADNRQHLAFEPPDYGALLGGTPGAGTIGGVFACNLSGPRRIKAGAARDHFLGVQAITGRGELIKSGGRVVKNVTGYDLCKLFAGSFGTLAVMTELTFKVLPAPEETRTVLIGRLERAEAFSALRTAMASAYEVAGAAYLPGTVAARSAVVDVADAGSGAALLRLEGPVPSVRYRADALSRLLGQPAARSSSSTPPRRSSSGGRFATSSYSRATRGRFGGYRPRLRPAPPWSRQSSSSSSSSGWPTGRAGCSGSPRMMATMAARP